MKVFVSWSGARSKFLAETLRWWLPLVIQSVKPWMSDEDISAGSRWLHEVSSQLSEAKLGIICVTPENQNNPWLLFEAGALSKTLDQTNVCPFLLELSRGQLTGPLSQFQENEVNNDGAYKILTLLNRSLGPDQIATKDLDEIFNVWWPKLEDRLNSVPSVEDKIPKPRSSEEILEEIVSNTREQLRRENVRLEQSRDDSEKFDRLNENAERLFLMFKNLPSLMETMVTKRAIPIPDELRKLASIQGSSIEEMQQMLSSMRATAETNRTFTDNILKTPHANGTLPDAKHGGEAGT
jgi:hypothetical protein